MLMPQENQHVQGPFAGRRALVVGGSGGIGREAALGLARGGAQVVATGSRAPAVVTGGQIKYLQCKIRTAGTKAGADGAGQDGLPAEQAAEFILSKAKEIFAGQAGGGQTTAKPAIDILICAWGPFFQAPIAETKPENWRILAENNLILPELLIFGVISDMINNGWGRILLFGGTGTAQIRGFRTTAAYSAAKTALGVLAKSVALEAGAAGVTCNVVCPGLTDTEYLDAAAKTRNRERSPGGKALEAAEIARSALDIIANPAINGAIVPIDKGIVL